MVKPSDLNAAVERYRVAKPDLKQPLLRSAVEMAKVLSDERDVLMARLETRWRWCAAHAGHPALIDREDAVLIDLATYEGMEDALSAAAVVLWGAAA